MSPRRDATCRPRPASLPPPDASAPGLGRAPAADEEKASEPPPPRPELWSPVSTARQAPKQPSSRAPGADASQPAPNKKGAHRVSARGPSSARSLRPACRGRLLGFPAGSIDGLLLNPPARDASDSTRDGGDDGRRSGGGGAPGAGAGVAEGAGPEPQRGRAQAAAADQRAPRHAPHPRPLRIPGTCARALRERASPPRRS